MVSIRNFSFSKSHFFCRRVFDILLTSNFPLAFRRARSLDLNHALLHETERLTAGSVGSPVVPTDAA